MNKLAFCEMHGREIGKNIWIAAQGSEMEKAAANNEEVNGDEAAYLESLVDDAAYHEQQQKLAHNNGAYAALTEVLQAAQAEDFDKEAFVADVTAAMDSIEKVALVAETQEEDQEMYARLVKGAATMLSHLYDLPIDEDVIKVAQQGVDAHLASFGGAEEA